MIESINSCSEYMLENILDRKLDSIRIAINEEFQKMFKKSVLDLKEKIELKIEDTIYEAVG